METNFLFQRIFVLFLFIFFLFFNSVLLHNTAFPFFLSFSNILLPLLLQV